MSSSSFSSDASDSYKWIVTLCCSSIVMMTLGVSRSTVVFLDDVKNHYNLSETQKVLFIVLPMCAGGLLSPIAAIICRKYSAKLFCLTASIIGGFCFILANYAAMPESSLNGGFLDCWACYITLITISGALFGGILVAAPIEVNKWFSAEQRSTANALVWTGSSIGALWIGPVFAKISEHTNWNQSLLILGIMQTTVIILAALFLKENSNKQLAIDNRVERVGFKVLWNFQLFKVYLMLQFCYVLWRAGYMVFLPEYAEQMRGWCPTKSALLLTVEASAEVFGRPSIGRFAQNRNRYTIVAVLFFIQACLTAVQPLMVSYWSFAVIVGCIGLVQGAAGGLFLTIIIDTVGVGLGRYGYSLQSALSVFVSGLGTQFYGVIGDALNGDFKFETNCANGTMIDTEFGAKHQQDYIFYLSAAFILLASALGLLGSKLAVFKEPNTDHDQEENTRLEEISK